MSYEIGWYVEKRVVFARYRGEMTIETLAEVSQKVAEYLDEGDPPVHYLADISALKSGPTNIGKAKRASDFLLQHPNLGWMILVGKQNPFFHFMASITTQITGIKLQSVATMEDGLQALQKADESLLEQH